MADNATGEDVFAEALAAGSAPQIEGTLDAGDAGQVEGDQAAVAAEAAPQPDPTQQTANEPEQRPAQDRNEGMVPSWRLREISEQRERDRAEYARAARELEELRQFKAQQEAERQRQEEEKRLSEGSLWEAQDPNAFIDARLRHGTEKMLSPVQQAVQDMREEMRQQAADFSHQIAVQQHGADKVQSAYARVQQAIAAGDPTALQLQSRVQNPRDRAFRDPTGAILAWDRDRHVLTETKGDLEAYRNRIIDEALKDPAFLARAQEAHRQQATPVQTGVPGRAPPPQTRSFPPSLNRESSAQRDDDEEMSAEAVFQGALNAPRRRA